MMVGGNNALNYYVENKDAEIFDVSTPSPFPTNSAYINISCKKHTECCIFLKTINRGHPTITYEKNGVSISSDALSSTKELYDGDKINITISKVAYDDCIASIIEIYSH